MKQVISVATGVTNRQRFQSQSSRRWLRSLGFTIGRGAVTAEAFAKGALTAHELRTRAPLRTALRPSADVVLVGCVKTKREQGPRPRSCTCRDYFTKMRTHAEVTGLSWFILSAEHGLVGPNDWLEPYERYLPNTPRDYRRAWGEKVAKQLEVAIGSLAGLAVEVHAGAAYVDSLEPPLRWRGAQLIDELKGLSIGRRLSWYLTHQEAGAADQRTVISQLRDPALALSPSDVLESARLL